MGYCVASVGASQWVAAAAPRSDRASSGMFAERRFSDDDSFDLRQRISSDDSFGEASRCLDVCFQAALQC
jgi:hypothetical protein